MTDEDDETDHTRACARCGSRPRWSKHGTCRLCAVCAGQRMTRHILLRKKDEPPRHVVQEPWVQRFMQRYHALRRHGLSSADARKWGQTREKMRQCLRALTKQ